MVGITSLGSQVFSALSQDSFNIFSSQVEGIHGTIHVAVGGSNPAGHMSVVDVAGFDPIFWLHHANVDRLTAIYQAAHTGTYLTPGPGAATFARIVPGIDGPWDDLNTNLYPFRHPNGAYFKTDEIKDASSIWAYNYGYDEVPCSYASRNAEDLAQYTRSSINALYGPRIVSGPFQPGNGKSPFRIPKDLDIN